MTDRDALARLVSAIDGYFSAKGREEADFAAFNELMRVLSETKEHMRFTREAHAHVISGLASTARNHSGD